jgi:hypothetical protein
MPRIIKSPVERWQGTITLCEPLTIEQCMAIEDALDALAETEPKASKYLSKINEGKVDLDWGSRQDVLFIPAIQGCIEKCELDGFTVHPWQGSPRGDSHLLVRALWSELLKIYQGEQQIPNE